MTKIKRRAYAARYGPTTGDRVRLADTDLVIEVEEDRTVYGEEAVFGAGGVLRDGMGQSRRRAAEVVDLVVAGVLILDYWGVTKADIGVKDGRIAAVGKAGNPDDRPGVDIPVGAATEIVAGEGLLATAGGVDAGAHFITSRQAECALMSGVTTLFGGGTGPADGSQAAAPGPWNIMRMLQAADALPVNIGLIGNGGSSAPGPLREQIAAGAAGLAVHRNRGVSPAVVDACLSAADEHDVQATISADGLNETGFVEDLLAVAAGRLFHAPYAEGADGGRVPDALLVCGEGGVLPSSCVSSPPYAGGAVHERAGARAQSRNRGGPASSEAPSGSGARNPARAARDILHDMGGLSMAGSGALSSGRAGDIIAGVWRTAHAMKLERGPLPEDSSRNDNFRAMRYVAKYTINPALAHGAAHEIGSIERGKMADIVLWRPAFFGVKPSLVIKGGVIAAAPMGDPGAALPNCEPVVYAPLFAATGAARAGTGVIFVSKAAQAAEVGLLYNLSKDTIAVTGARKLSKKDMVLNEASPDIRIDHETGDVRADGVLLAAEPAETLPLSQRYFLF